VERVEQTETGIVVHVRGKREPQCTVCFSRRVAYRRPYPRALRDLPWPGQPVRIPLRLRRFRCRNQQCHRKVFAARLPGVVAPRERDTKHRCAALRRVGYARGGLPRCRRLNILGMVSGDDTVLRRVIGFDVAANDNELGQGPTKQQLHWSGVNELFWRNGQFFGTLVLLKS